jgi:hypothetical protein
VGTRAVLDAVVKRKIPSPRWESNRRTPIVQPVAQRNVNSMKHSPFRKLTVAQLVKKLAALHGTEGSLPCSQEPVIRAYR